MADTFVNKYTTATNTSTNNITDAIGANETLTILSVSICNNTDTDTTFRMWASSSTFGIDAFIYHTQPLPGRSTFIHNSKIVLRQNDVLKFNCVATANPTQICINALKQTAVSTSADYLDRHMVHTSSGSDVLITPDSLAYPKVVLGFTVCNNSTTTATTFDISARESGGTARLIYNNQSIPPSSTFEHTDKIILATNEELLFNQAATLTLSILTAYLRQP